MSNPAQASWSLHPDLEHNSVPVGDLALSRVIVADDATYPWVVLVPRRAGAVEIIDLDEPDRIRLMAEIAQVSTALKELTRCDKLNVAALGNIVSQLHVHVVARRTDDAAWPGPVWGAVPPERYEDTTLETFVTALRAALAIT